MLSAVHMHVALRVHFFYLIRERKTLEVLEQIKSRVGMMAHFMPFSPAGEYLAFTHVGVRVD